MRSPGHLVTNGDPRFEGGKITAMGMCACHVVGVLTHIEMLCYLMLCSQQVFFCTVQMRKQTQRCSRGGPASHSRVQVRRTHVLKVCSSWLCRGFSHPSFLFHFPFLSFSTFFLPSVPPLHPCMAYSCLGQHTDSLGSSPKALACVRGSPSTRLDCGLLPYF